MAHGAVFDYALDDAAQSPVCLECCSERLVATGGTAAVFRCVLDGREAVVKRIENILDVPHTLFKRNTTVSVNTKHVMDAEVALHARVSAFGIASAPALYGVVRLSTGCVEFRGTDVERWTYFLFMEYVPGETLLDFLRNRRGILLRKQTDALVRALKDTCDAFVEHAIMLDDRNNPANIIVQVDTEETPTYRIIFIDFQCNRWHHRTPSDMFSQPAWLICVAAACAEHAHTRCTKSGGVLPRARCLFFEVVGQTAPKKIK
jgi:hypothetical protein